MPNHNLSLCPKRLAYGLLILRVTLALFLGLWASLKFFRPEWMVNVFRGSYGLEFITQDYSFAVGSVQMLIVVLFVIGYKQTVFYALMLAMHLVGTFGAIPGFLNFTNYPNNLLLTSIPTLGAFAVLFLLRHHDLLTLDHFIKKQRS